MSLVKQLARNPLFPLINLPRRAALTFPGYVWPLQRRWLGWLFASREDTNFTYDLTPVCLRNLAHGLATVLDRPPGEIAAYFEELRADEPLARWIRERSAQGARRYRSDLEARFGRRLAWYAAVRARKPAVVVETGVDKGLGSVVLCAALLRNAAEGAPGRYFGTDINPEAGELLGGEYASVGRILLGDSLESLSSLPLAIDLFINDSDHSASYEAAEYEMVAPKMSQAGMILGDNAHVTTKLSEFAEKNGYRFVFLNEQPAGHFHPGCGVGIAWR